MSYMNDYLWLQLQNLNRLYKENSRAIHMFLMAAIA